MRCAGCDFRLSVPYNQLESSEMYRYLGNKTRLAPWLVAQIKELAAPGATVADPMCGTASVSEALRAAGFRVFASDIMTYAAHHARVRLFLNEAPSFDGLGLRYGEILSQLNALAPKCGLFHREYSPEGSPQSKTEPRKYLSPLNAGKLDAMNQVILEWHRDGLISEVENSLLRHDLILAVNRIANIAGTYGHYRSSWSKAALAELSVRPNRFVAGYRTDHVVMQGPAEELAEKIVADVCYLDPPYMKRQYAANYHLIETIARGDEPEAVGVSGLRPWRDQYSDFCTRTRIQEAFRRLIEGADCPVFLISYSSDGLLSEHELKELFDELGDVSMEKRIFPRFKSNQSKLGAHVTEFLITVRKKNFWREQVPRAVGAM